jgi:hypothetical protein
MSAEPARDARLRRTLEQLRHLREHTIQRNAIDIERRRLEDQVREERHDAFARTISAATQGADADAPPHPPETQSVRRNNPTGRTRLKRN